MSERPVCKFCDSAFTNVTEMTTATGTSLAADCPVCGTYVIAEESWALYNGMDMMTQFQVMAKVEAKWKQTGQPVTVTPDFFK